MIARPIVALLAFGALAGATPAAAQIQMPPSEQTLPGEQVLELISGAWEADPIETPEANRGTHRCEQQPEIISIRETDQGPVFEYTRGNTENPVILRSAIHSLTSALLIQYDEEWRLTPEGEPVRWMFFMPDKDHFFMARLDWVRDGRFNRTTMRRRCPESSVS